MEKICALILARKNSKRIQNKNFKLLHKKPLFYYSLNEASKVNFIKDVFLMTDSKVLKDKASKLNISKLKIIGRSKKSSTDFAQSEIAIGEFLENHDYKHIIFIQLTNVFITRQDIIRGFENFKKNKLDSLLSVVESDKFIWSNSNKNFKTDSYELNNRPLSKKDKKTYYIENGSFYIFSKTGFQKYKNRLYGRIGVHKMNKESIFDIDEVADLNLVKKIFKAN